MGAIVVGVDSSVESERALDRALLQAGGSERPLRVVHAWTAPDWATATPGYNSPDPEARARTETLAQERVDEFLAKAQTRLPVGAGIAGIGTLDVRTEVYEGEPGRVLVRAAQDADLVIIGGRGHGYVASAVLGSATGYVLHHAPCPVMVVPAHGPPAAPFRHVYVGVDGSASSRSALRWAQQQARIQALPLTAVYAWQSSTTPGRPAMRLAPTFAEHQAAAQTWLEQDIAVALAEGPSAHSQPEVAAELVHGAAAWGLMQRASADDLLVLGSRGRGGFASLVLGSVATQCAQHASGVVVVVREGQDVLP